MQLPPYKLPVPGDMVGHYLVLEPVGRGGQGHVYKAKYAGRLFALKFFQAHPVAPWGEHELDILRRVKHPNVVRVLGYGRWPDPERGFLYIIMEWVEGLTLEDHAAVHGVSAREAATLALKMARALGAVHAAGVRHRDVKPENILIRESDGEPVLVDFGVAHLEGLSSVEGRGQVVGTREFYSPQAYDFLWEHYGDGVLYRADLSDEVWALGVTLYWLLTGELPFGSRFTNLSRSGARGDAGCRAWRPPEWRCCPYAPWPWTPSGGRLSYGCPWWWWPPWACGSSSRARVCPCPMQARSSRVPLHLER